MTTNGVMTLILRYFADFVYDVFVKQNYLGFKLLIVYDYIRPNTICAIIQRLFGKTNSYNSV